MEKQTIKHKKDPNVTSLENSIEQMEKELSEASFGGDRWKVPVLLKQLKQARKILADMNSG